MNLYKLKKILKPYNMAILSVFISIFSVCTVSLISMAGKSEIASELDGVGLNGMSVTAYDSYGDNITDKELYNILKECPEVETLTPVLFDYAQLEFTNGYTAESLCWGISPTAEKIVNLSRLHGRMFLNRDIDSNEMVCLIDENLAMASYGRSDITGKNVYLSSPAGVYSFNIIGVVNKSSSVLNGLSGEIIPNFIYVPFTTMENIYHKSNLDKILINVYNDDINEADITDYVMRNSLIGNGISMKVANLSQQRETINNIVDIAFFALFAVSCVAIIVCSISVGASVNTAVSNARHDIGIKMSIGARKSDIVGEFLLYSFIACLLGIGYGFSAGLILLIVVNTVCGMAYTFDTILLVRGISATIFLAVVFSFYPSWQAAGMLPVKALNRE